MSTVQIFACLLASASCLNIMRGSDENAYWVDEPDAEETNECVNSLPDAIPLDISLASDTTLSQNKKDLTVFEDLHEFWQPSMNKFDSGSHQGAPEAKQQKYKDALEEYRIKKGKFAKAMAKVATSLDSLLAVPRADAKSLKALAKGGGKDTLVVFYAPWCPHCQTFVMHDDKGNPLGAPLESLRRDLKANKSTKDVEIVRADVTKVGKGKIPVEFKVVGIPTVYFATKNGKVTQFAGNPHDTLALTSFVNKQVA